jgi:thiamine biosynthesis protein ThiI
MSVTDPTATAAVRAAGQSAPRVPGEPCVVLKLGEIVLKGRNRQQFERLQQRNIKAAVKGTGLPTEVLHREGVVLVRVPVEGCSADEHAAAVDTVAKRVADVPGIVRVCRAWRVEKTPEAAVAAAV